MEKLLICENSKVVLTVYKHWNIRFALTNLLLLQHKNIVINFYKFMADPQLHTAVCIFPPTIWHLYTLALPSFPSLLSLSFIFVPVIGFDPECKPTVTKFRSALRIEANAMTWAKSERPARRGRRRREGKSDTCAIWRKKRYIRQDTICTCYDILSLLFSAHA